MKYGEILGFYIYQELPTISSVSVIDDQVILETFTHLLEICIEFSQSICSIHKICAMIKCINAGNMRH
jgi:hypothetical protein